jgi:hypothetical protein
MFTVRYYGVRRIPKRYWRTQPPDNPQEASTNPASNSEATESQQDDVCVKTRQKDNDIVFIP